MSERIIIKNGTVVTMNDADDVVFGGTVVIEGDRITDVGPDSDVVARQSADGAKVIDAEGKAVLPGLVDLHFHTAVGKGWSDHLPLWEYLETCWYPIIRALEPRGGVLGRARQLQRVDQVRRHDGERHVPPARRARARRRGDRDPRGAVERRRRRRARPGHAGGQQARRTRQSNGAANGRIEVYIGIEWLPLASEGLLKEARDARRRPRHRHPHPPQRVADRGGELQAAVRPAAHRGRLRLRDPVRPVHRGALRLALGRRDRADARDRDADLAQPVVEREARQRDRARARDAGGRDQRGAGPRRGRVQQQPRPVRGDEVRVADPPRQPGGPEPAAGARRGADGHAQRLGGAAARDRRAHAPARRPT